MWTEWGRRTKPGIDAEELDLIRRLLILRKQGRVGPILAEFGSYWICTSELDPHGSKEYYPYDKLKELIERIESEPWIDKIERKQVGTAQEITPSPEERAAARRRNIKRIVNGGD